MPRDNDSKSPATNSQPFRGPSRALHNWQLTRADRWTSTDDQLLLDTVALYRGSSDSWATIVECFNTVSDKQRTFAALESRWRFLQGSKKTRNQTSAPAPVVGGSTTAAVSSAASTATPAPTAGPRKAATKAGWSSEEVQVLRQSLRQNPGIPGSYPAIYEQFYKTFPTSTRTRSALRLKCETMIGLAARRDEYQSTDEEGDSGEESERGAGKRGAKRAGGLVEKVGNVKKRPVNKTPRLYYDNGERSGGGTTSGTASSATRVTRSKQTTDSPRATHRPRARSSARATRTPPHDNEAWTRQAYEPDNATWNRQAREPSAPLDYGLAVSITYHASGILVTGAFPGLEVLVFSPTCVQLKSAADLTDSDSYEGRPAFHLRVAEDGSVQAVGAPPGATMGVRLVPEEGQRVGGGAVAAVRGAVQSTCTGVDGFEVALRS